MKKIKGKSKIDFSTVKVVLEDYLPKKLWAMYDSEYTAFIRVKEGEFWKSFSVRCRGNDKDLHEEVEKLVRDTYGKDIDVIRITYT